MFDFLKNKNVIIGIIILAIVIFTIWYFYNRGKSVPTTVKPILDNPDSSSSSNNPAGYNAAQLKVLVDVAHEDYDSTYNDIFGKHDPDVYIPIIQLSDTDFTRAYNIWNTSYQEKDERTMVQAIDSLFGTWNDFSFPIVGQIGNIFSGLGGSSLSQIQDIFRQKASRLNLP